MISRKTWRIGGAAVAAAIIAGAGVAVVAANVNDDDRRITGETLDRASAAAVAHTGGGRVTEAEVNDGWPGYEVEVTLDDGREVDVYMDEQFNVVGDDPDYRDDGASQDDRSLTGDALERASAAALAHTGGGRVTDAEVSDGWPGYEVEVTLDDGREVDVYMDEQFNVVGDETDGTRDD